MSNQDKFLTDALEDRDDEDREGPCYILFDDTIHTHLELAHEDDWEGIQHAALHSGARFRSLFSYDYATWIDFLENGDPELTKTGCPKYGDFPEDVPYTARTVVIDVDSDELYWAASPTLRFCEWLDSRQVPFRLWHSGKKGYHVCIPRGAVGYGRETGLAGTMKRFVKLLIDEFVDETGGSAPPIDEKVYNRSRKIRLPGDCRGEIAGAVRYKSPIRPLDIEGSTHCGWDFTTQEPDEFLLLPEPYSPKEYLVDLWERAKQTPSRTVTVHQPFPRSARTSDGSAEWKNLEDLVAEIERRPKSIRSGSMVRHSCVNPAHTDRNPSAAIWDDGGYNCFKCGKYGAAKVAEWMGFDLERSESSRSKSSSEDPEEKTLSDARDELMRTMRGFLYGEANAVFTVPVGVGKSWTARRLAEEDGPVAVLEPGEDAIGLELQFDADEFPVTYSRANWVEDISWIDWQPQRTFGFLGDSYDLLREQIADLPRGEALDKPWVLEDRCESEPMGQEGKKSTRRKEIEWRESIGEPKGSVCATCPLNPDSPAFDDTRESCEYRKQLETMRENDDIAWLAKAYVGIPERMEEFTSQCTHIICDEDIVPYIHPVRSFDVDKLRRAESSAATIPYAGSEEKSLRVGELISLLLEGNVPVATDDGGGRLIHRWTRTANWEGRPADLDPNDPDAEWKARDNRVYNLPEEGDRPVDITFGDLSVNAEAQRLLGFLKYNLIQDAAVRDGILYVRGVIEWTEYLSSCQMLVLDASHSELDKMATRQLTRRVPEVSVEEWEAEREAMIERKRQAWIEDQGGGLMADDDEAPDFEAMVPKSPPNAGMRRVEPSFHEIEISNKDTTVIHDPSAMFSRQGKVRFIKRFDDERDDDGGCDRLTPLIELVDHLVDDADGEDNIGVISHKQSPQDEFFIDRLFDECASDLNADDHFMYFGNLRGKDRFKGVEHLVIIGDPGLPTPAFRAEMMRWRGKPEKPFLREEGEPEAPNIIDEECGYTPFDGRYSLHYPAISPDTDREREVHGHSLVRHVWDRLLQRELYQAVGRARGIEHDCKVWLFSATHPGSLVKTQFTHEIDKRLLTSKKSQAKHVEVIDMDDYREAFQRANMTMDTYEDIAEDTDLRAETVSNMTKANSKRARRREFAWWLIEKEGLTQKKVAKKLQRSARQVRRWLKQVNDKMKPIPHNMYFHEYINQLGSDD